VGDTERCQACGEPVSVTDLGGCVGAGPHWHYRADCLLEAARRERANSEGAVEALKLIACARAQSAQHAIDVGLARNALEAMGVDPSHWRGQ
jgi:hypothetical protein